VKTISLKKVSAVAVASLGFGLLSVVPANAVGAAEIEVRAALVKGSTSQATTATGVVGNQVIFRFDTDSAATVWRINSDSKGRIVSADQTAGTATTLVGTNGLNFNDGVTYTADTNVRLLDVGVTATVAGTNVVKIQTLSATTGLYSTTASLTITWLDAATSAGISAANSTIYAVADAGTCTFGASKAGDVAAAAANADTKTSVPTGTALDICIAPRNGNGDLVAITAASTVLSSLGASASLAAATSQQEDAFTGATAPISGPATITAILIDALGNAATISTTVTYWSSLSKLTLTPLVSAAYAAADQTAPAGNTYAQYVAAAAGSLKTLVVGMKATDASGSTINLATSANSTATSAWTIDSDKVAGTPAARTSDALGAAVSAQSVSGESSSTKWGVNAAYITCSTKPEKLTLTAFGKNSDGDWVASNTLDVYCSGAVDKITVKPAATSVAAGGVTTVNVDIKDANGYPAADNTSVTLTASDGSSIAPSSKSTASGVFTSGVNLVAGSNAASTIVTAIAGSKSGSEKVNITGASSNSSITTQIDALNAKIVALNALIAKIMKKLGVK
jgi:hypothetical protein